MKVETEPLHLWRDIGIEANHFITARVFYQFILKTKYQSSNLFLFAILF